MLGISPWEVLIIVAALLVGIGSLILWIWMLIDCATKESDQGNDKVVWIIIIAVLQLIGALLYLFVRRPRRIRELGR